MRRGSVSNIVAALILLGAGVAWGQSQTANPVQVVTVRDTLTAARYAAEITALRIERDGWRTALEAIEDRPPAQVLVSDTLIKVLPDTVILFVSVRDGSVSSERLVAQPTVDSVGPTWRPELYTNSSISDCDDGWEVSASGVVCDRAALGHLSLYAEWANVSSLGMAWTPTYRSLWDMSVGHTGSEWVFRVRRGLRLF